MKRKRYSEEEIIAILKEHEARMKTADLCRKHGISDATFYNWKAANPQSRVTIGPCSAGTVSRGAGADCAGAIANRRCVSVGREGVEWAAGGGIEYGFAKNRTSRSNTCTSTSAISPSVLWRPTGSFAGR
jgi:hypothetical protein